MEGLGLPFGLMFGIPIGAAVGVSPGIILNRIIASLCKKEEEKQK